MIYLTPPEHIKLPAKNLKATTRREKRQWKNDLIRRYLNNKLLGLVNVNIN